MKKYFSFLFSSWFMGALFIVFAISMAFATFIENDYGAAAARQLVYGTKWFELIFILMVINLVGQLIVNKLLTLKKLPIALFHISFIIMIIGAAITRYFGFEGNIHIREGESTNICMSTDRYIKLEVKDEKGISNIVDSRKFVVTSSSVDGYQKNFVINNSSYKVSRTKVIKNAMESIFETPDGKPIAYIIIAKQMGAREPFVLSSGETKELSGLVFNFANGNDCDVKLSFNDDSFYLESKHLVAVRPMNSNQTTFLKLGERTSAKTMTLYTIKGYSVVFQKLSPSGIVKPISIDHQGMKSKKSVLQFELVSGNMTKELNIWLSTNQDYSSDSVLINGNRIKLTYGSHKVALPFSIKLNKFILERYPGSTSPSSYKSDVVLIDSAQGIEKPYSIYMNHILKHRGYRFYQSSYDEDEKGTILSVNHDRFGMFITYLGYILLFVFILISIFSKNSLFKNISANAWKSPMKKALTLIIAIFLGTNLSIGQEKKLVIDKAVADRFGKVLVQDQKGRTKPLITLSNDIVRKLTKTNQFENYSSMQVFLGYYADFDHWKDVPIIKVTNADLAKKIGISGSYASFSDIVDLNANSYKLVNYVQEAYAKPEGSRNKFDKEVIKLDEKVNVLYMIYSGSFLKIIPLKDKSTKWGSPGEAVDFADSKEDSLYLAKIMPLIIETAQRAAISKNYKEVNEFIESISDYQKKFSTYTLPSDTKVSIEVFYSKAKIYEKLFPFYATVGLLLVFVLIYFIVLGKETAKATRFFSYFLIVGFIAHTIGLGIRWYISGHAPMSNGYESMLFLSWATLLAGFIFSKRSPFALAATAVLSALTLLVAHLSFMDPEITNLVPVLKSYWLTLHVSVIIGSYGFLGLGAILGLIVMILYLLVNVKNRERILKTIDELTIINYKTLTLGLYFLTIGTFLGAVWANESWGRYWGWDPKETWSLITMIVYSFVIHSRMIKSFRSVYTFNLISLFAFSSVLMTYFGVNYYLSGLHSYASGDPIPVPTFVYVTVITLIVVAVLALRKYKKLKLE